MSRESYISGFVKTAHSHGVDPGMLVKIAQLLFADKYFKYDPEKINDIFLSLDPELEQKLLDTADRTSVTSIKPSGSSGTWRDYSPKPVSTATAPKKVKMPQRVSGLDRIPLAVKRLMPVIKKSLPRLVKTVR